MSDALVERWRDEFPILASSNYLISNSLGAMPTRARERAAQYTDEWNTRGVRAWAEGWWQLQFEFAAVVERLLGVGTGTVSMHQNVAMASQAILSCFDLTGARNKIVYTDMNFPSVMYLYEETARAVGAEVVRVPADEDGIGVDQQKLLDAIDEKTAIVPISHVLFRSAFVQDARAVVEKARKVGAFVVLDVYQSVGAIPLALEELGVHAAVGGVLKYCCGGPGNSFLYVRPDEVKRLRPRFTGWSAHKDPFAFSAEGQDFRDDGGRFLNGTPNVPALYAGIEGTKIVTDEVGVAAIREKSRGMTQAIIDRCDQLGLGIKSPRDPERRGNHVSIDVPDGYWVCQALLAEDIVVDYRPKAGLRLSPHFYNTPEEPVAAVDRIGQVLESGEFERFKAQGKKPG
jgi:kynureninase